MIKYFFDETKKEFQLYIGKNAGWHIYFNDIAQENGTYKHSIGLGFICISWGC